MFTEMFIGTPAASSAGAPAGVSAGVSVAISAPTWAAPPRPGLGRCLTASITAS